MSNKQNDPVKDGNITHETAGHCVQYGQMTLLLGPMNSAHSTHSHFQSHNVQYNHNLSQFLFSAQKTPQGASFPCVRNLTEERSRAVNEISGLSYAVVSTLNSVLR
jgi:hypothetical protein